MGSKHYASLFKYLFMIISLFVVSTLFNFEEIEATCFAPDLALIQQYSSEQECLSNNVNNIWYERESKSGVNEGPQITFDNKKLNSYYSDVRVLVSSNTNLDFNYCYYKYTGSINTPMYSLDNCNGSYKRINDNAGYIDISAFKGVFNETKYLHVKVRDINHNYLIYKKDNNGPIVKLSLNGGRINKSYLEVDINVFDDLSGVNKQSFEYSWDGVNFKRVNLDSNNMTTIREDFFSNEKTLTIGVSDNSNNWTYFTSNKFIFTGFEQETSNYSYNQCVKNKFFKPSNCVEEVKIIDFDYYDVTIGSWKDSFFDRESVNKTYILNTVYPKVVASISFSNIFEDKNDYKTTGELRIKAPSGETISVGTRRNLTLKLNDTGVYLFSFYPSKSVPKTFRNPSYFRIVVDGYPPSVNLAVNKDSDNKNIRDVTLSIKDNVKLDFTHCYYAWHSNSVTPDYLNSCDLSKVSDSEGELTLLLPENIKNNPYLHVVFSDVIGTKSYRFNLTDHLKVSISTTNTSTPFKNKGVAVLDITTINKNGVMEVNKLSYEILILGVIFVTIFFTYFAIYLKRKQGNK